MKTTARVGRETKKRAHKVSRERSKPVARSAPSGGAVDNGKNGSPEPIRIVVVDDHQAPVGIVDSQDLTRLKLL